jgi:hypothetical protein
MNTMIWREHRTLLIALGVLLLANAIFFFTYRVQYEARLHALDQRLEQSEEGLQHARERRITAEQQLASYNRVQVDLENLYTRTWSTKAQRLTALINELKHMGAVTQLDPNSMSFSQAQEKDAGRNGRPDMSIVTITFSVKGTYQQIRRLINLLEVSDQFVIINSIHLGGGGQPDLNLDLSLKTVFRELPGSKIAVTKQL